MSARSPGKKTRKQETVRAREASSTKKEGVGREDEDRIGNKRKKEAGDEVETPVKVKRKRKTKEEKEAEAMPLASRTLGLKLHIGAHVSSAKGLLVASIYALPHTEILVRSRNPQCRHQLSPYRVIPEPHSPLLALTRLQWQCVRRLPEVPAQVGEPLITA